MRVVFFGTPEFAVPTLLRLLDAADMEVLGVVTQPDVRRGRGNQEMPSPVKAVAVQHGLPVWQPARLKRDAATIAALAAANADVFVVVAYGQILSQTVLDLPARGCINVHGSLLPKYRGAAPIQRAIAAGETETGITTMQMDAGIDTGAMLLKAAIPIAPEDNAETLSQRLAALGAELLLQTLRQLDTIAPQPQDDSAATYAPIIAKQEWALDWNQPARVLRDRIRGFYPNCFACLRDRRLSFHAAEVWAGDVAADPAPSPGTVVALRKREGFVVQAGEGQLLVTAVQPAGKRPQSGWDFVNGARLQVGDRFA